MTDTTGPVISITGSTTVTHEAATTYTDAGATALDAVGGALDVTTTGTVTEGAPGAYTLTYSVTDSSGNTTTATRTVTVQDTVGPVITLNGSGTVNHLDAVKPVITLIGSSSVFQVAGATYSDLGAVATDETSAYVDAGSRAVDALDGDVAVVVTGSVSVETAGEYILTFTAADTVGNETTATRVVTVPALVKNVSSSIVTTSSVNENKAGSYQVQYNVSDSAGNAAATVSRTVDVADPVNIVVQPSGGTLELGSSVELWVLATGNGELSYQWKKYGVAIAGETSNILTLTDVTAVDSGSYSVTIQDSLSTVDSAEAIIRAGDQMVLGMIADQFVKTGDSLSVAVQLAGKPANLKYLLTGAPDGMNISSEGLISWAVGAEHDGNSYNVRATAIDKDALMAVGRAFNVTVNHNPKWEVIGAQSVKEQNLLTFSPVAEDLDGDDLVLTAIVLPIGASYNAGSGFSWNPASNQVGAHDARFTATDSHGSISELALKINVLANVGPTLAAIDQVNILAGESVSVQLSAADTDDDTVTLGYSLNNAPEGMQVTDTGLITWVTESGTHSGGYTADAVVTDPIGASVSKQLNVVVNGAPVVDAIAPITVKSGYSVSFTVAATDPEGGKLTYKGLGEPDGFKGNVRNGFGGKFIWRTQNAIPGDYKIDVEVSDAVGLKSVISVQVTLKANVAPTIDPIDAVVIDTGETLTVQVVADDPDGDNSKLQYQLIDAPEGMQISDSGLIQWAVGDNEQDAELSVTVSAVDDRDAAVSQILTVIVKADKPPTVEAIEPIVAKVGDNVGFTISATDPEGGELRYKALNTPAGFKRKVRNGYNGVFLWYTTKASEGDYSIDIEVKNAEGLKTVVVAQIKLESMTTVTLLTASSVVGPYAPETAAVIDENAQTITVAKAGGIRFYKLQSGDDAKLKITSFAIQGDNVVMSYQPAGD